MSVVCCQVVVSATRRSLVQRIPAKYDVCEYDLETSTKGRSRCTRNFEQQVPPQKKKNYSVTAIEIFEDRNIHQNGVL